MSLTNSTWVASTIVIASVSKFWQSTRGHSNFHDARGSLSRYANLVEGFSTIYSHEARMLTASAEVCKWYALIPPFVTIITTFFINAPFGRFALSENWKLQVDGINSWIVMELVSPLVFVYHLLRAPLSGPGDRFETLVVPSLRHPPTLLALLYLIHYANRSLISPLRTPSRSKAHVIVPILAIFFNTINGSLMGTYFSSPACQSFLVSGPVHAYARPSFWVGLALWAIGFVGNIIHDEILLNIRRKAQGKKHDGKEHYAIPRGYLYCLISYPNYFCEWVEWAGFALAAAPIPELSFAGFTTAAPPWLFLFAEVFTMAPRAYQGHKWYHRKFPDYPKERRAVIPFIL